MLPSRLALLLVSGRYLLVRRHAGHSKWSNIRHVKGANDDSRSRQIALTLKRMRGAAVVDGPDPFTNPRLQAIVEEAQAANVPNTTLQSALKRMQSEREDGKPGLLEVRGPAGSYLIIDVVTANSTRTRGDVASVLRKNRAQIADAQHAFDKRGFVVTELMQPDDADVLEVATEHAIESGAEDVQLQEGQDASRVLVFTTGWQELFHVRKALVLLGYKVVSTDAEYVPRVLVSLTGADAQLYSRMMDKLEEMPDVVTVTSNVQLPDS